jgi:hypothetical protein
MHQFMLRNLINLILLRSYNLFYWLNYIYLWQLEFEDKNLMALVPLIKKMEYLNSQGSKNYYLAPLFDIFESRKNN